MNLPPNVVLFPGRRVRSVPRQPTRAERIEGAVGPVVAIGVILIIWAILGYALWQLAASTF